MRGAGGICSIGVYLWALAAARGETLTLQRAIDEALRNNPVIKQSLDRIRSAEGLKLQAGLKPNPRVVFQNENPNRSCECAHRKGTKGTHASALDG